MIEDALLKIMREEILNSLNNKKRITKLLKKLIHNIKKNQARVCKIDVSFPMMGIHVAHLELTFEFNDLSEIKPQDKR